MQVVNRLLHRNRNSPSQSFRVIKIKKKCKLFKNVPIQNPNLILPNRMLNISPYGVMLILRLFHCFNWLVVDMHHTHLSPWESSSESSDTGSPMELEPEHHVCCSKIHPRFSRNSVPRANGGPQVC